MGRKRDSLELRVVLDGIVRDFGLKQTIVVLAGAAVSLDSPANLPTADDFKEALARTVLQFDENPNEIADLPQVLKARKVPFERLLQQIYDTMADSQPRIITDLLISTFGIGEPNQNHKVLADYLAKGRIQLLLTTNFDNLFERAGHGIDQVVTETQWERLSKELIKGTLYRPTIAHLHGSLSKPGSLVTLMNQVGRELQGPRRRVLEHLLTNSIMVFVGYSGTDEDINPVLHAYPAKGQWWLLKPGDKPDTPQKQQYRTVQLVAHRSVLSDEAFQKMFDSMSQPDLRRLSGAILISAGIYDSAILRLARALNQQQRYSTILSLATAVRAEQYFHWAEQLLEKTPPRAWGYWPMWMDTRAFTRRHLGKFEESAKDFQQLRIELEQRLGNPRQRDRFVSELMQIAEHEIEVLLLIAARKRGKEQENILAHCKELMDKCRSWLHSTNKLAPTFELYYYDAEIALLRGEMEAAREGYRLYEEKGTHWLGSNIITFVSLRQAVVEAAVGNLRAALRICREGYQAAKPPVSLMVRIQFLMILPALFISPLRGYWLMRILAARLYGLYGRFKFALLRIRHPSLYREIIQSLQAVRAGTVFEEEQR